jgi:CubicO group peptidase (beta-lactamase class C family)
MRGRALLGTGALALVVVLAGCTGGASTDVSGPRDGAASPAAGGESGGTPVAWDAARAGRRLDQLVRADGSSWSSLRTVVVSHDGKVVLSRHYGGSHDRPRDLSTVTTTVVGTLAGIAVRRHLLKPSERLAHLLPEHAADMTPVVASITLRQLLTMQSGLPADLRRATRPWFLGQPSWAGAIVGEGLSGNPTQFSFTTANAQLVAAALHDATGQTLRAYAERTLFRPLGITRPVRWPLGRTTGEDMAFGGLELDARELLRLGTLYLDGGTARGSRVLTPDWVQRATRDQQYELDPGGYGYGYLWWVKTFGGHRTYAALGEGAQLLEVVPDLGLVVVALGDVDPSFGLDGAALQTDLNAVLLPDGS